MVFSSFLFLSLFLPLFLAAYLLSPRSLRNMVALLFSLFFYTWGAPKIIGTLVAGSFLDYLVSKHFSGRYRKISFAAGVGANLLLLGYFKYANFFVADANALIVWLGGEPITWSAVALPVGISFFTFQKISYLADVYCRRTEPAAKFSHYLLYVTLFPQLIAGPIIRYHDVAQDILRRELSAQNIWYGFFRFSVGLGKKVLIADELAKIVDTIFGIDPAILPAHYALLGMTCYAFQIYFDFSGYSDMALGLGRVMGFRFPENFNMPYISQSITEFWRRWHISLSNWMRDYLYIPLGGNRCGLFRTYLDLWIVFLISGLWHGASWTFVLWGAYHGFFLVLDKLFWLRVSKRLPAPLNVLITFTIVSLGWVLFRSESLEFSWQYIQALSNLSSWGAPLGSYYPAQIIHNRGIFVLTIAVLLSFAPIAPALREMAEAALAGGSSLRRLGLEFAAASALLLLSMLVVGSGSFSPFLYFRF